MEDQSTIDNLNAEVTKLKNDVSTLKTAKG